MEPLSSIWKREQDLADLMASSLGNLLQMPWEFRPCLWGTFSELPYGWGRAERRKRINIVYSPWFILQGCENPVLPGRDHNETDRSPWRKCSLASWWIVIDIKNGQKQFINHKWYNTLYCNCLIANRFPRNALDSGSGLLYPERRPSVISTGEQMQFQAERFWYFLSIGEKKAKQQSCMSGLQSFVNDKDNFFAEEDDFFKYQRTPSSIFLCLLFIMFWL